MPKFKKIKCRIIGRKGAGKSSLINAIVGEKIADVGVTETTMEVGQPYENRGLLFYDLPGYPTEKFPRETYIEKMGIKDSDCVIIVTSDRFYEDELLLIKEISKIQPPIAIYAVRTKIDYSVQRNKKIGVDEETILKKIYEELRDNIQDAPVKGIYLISADYPTGYDLNKLLNDISSNLSEVDSTNKANFSGNKIKTIEEKNITMEEIFEKFGDIFGGHYKKSSKEEQIISILKKYKEDAEKEYKFGDLNKIVYYFNLSRSKKGLRDLSGELMPEKEEDEYRSKCNLGDYTSFYMKIGKIFFITGNKLFLLKNEEWQEIEWSRISDISSTSFNSFCISIYSELPSKIEICFPFYNINDVTDVSTNRSVESLLKEIIKVWEGDSLWREYCKVKKEINSFNEENEYDKSLSFIEENKDILSFVDYSYPYFYERIKILILKGRREEAFFEFSRFQQIEKKSESSQQKEVYNYYRLNIELLINEMKHNYYEISLKYEKIRDLMKEKSFDEVLEFERNKNKNYANFVANFKELPLRERNIITFSDTDKLFKSEHITLLNINQQLPEIHFPQHHPKVNQTYIAHPYKTDSYLPIENYDYELLNDRLNEFFYILQCLGATSITFETIEEENKEEKNHSNLKAEAEAKTKIAGGKVEVDYDSLMNSSLRNYLKMERTQTFDPEKRPYVPKDVVWFPNEFSWQRLAQQRLNGNFLTHNEVLSSSQTQTLSSSEIVDVNAELKMLFTSVKAGVHYQEEKEIKQNRDFSFRISVKFKPMNEFPEETEIIDITAEEVTQTPIQLPAPNDNEARYLEEIHFMLEDDGQIDERERMILERLRERYNITPERAKELEAQAIAGQELTSEEQEYLSEYKNSLHDGAISDKERRLLNRLAMALGISEERVTEIEKLI